MAFAARGVIDDGVLSRSAVMGSLPRLSFCKSKSLPEAELMAANVSVAPRFHPGAFSSCSSFLIASASSGLIGLLPQRGSVLCKAPIIARVTGSGAQP